jgi:hypothetical protein
VPDLQNQNSESPSDPKAQYPRFCILNWQPKSPTPEETEAAEDSE